MTPGPRSAASEPEALAPHASPSAQRLLWRHTASFLLALRRAYDCGDSISEHQPPETMDSWYWRGKIYSVSHALQTTGWHIQVHGRRITSSFTGRLVYHPMAVEDIVKEAEHHSRYQRSMASTRCLSFSSGISQAVMCHRTLTRRNPQIPAHSCGRPSAELSRCRVASCCMSIRASAVWYHFLILNEGRDVAVNTLFSL